MALLENAQLAWLESGQPHSLRFDDIYFSRSGGPAESHHVFMDGNALPARFAAAALTGRDFHIGELGFGTGLNFLLAWQLWHAQPRNTGTLYYLAFEHYPLTGDDLRRALSNWPQLAPMSDRLLSVYVEHTPGLHRVAVDDRVVLDLYLGDATEGLQRIAVPTDGRIDCWLLDGFAPSKNPDMWSAALFRQLAHHSHGETTLSTYSVAGSVRAGLENAGFRLCRRPGFGAKREMLAGVFGNRDAADETPSGQPSRRARWQQIPDRDWKTRSALIIGAGLAGCSTARALVMRGWNVTVLDAGDGPAAGASGNAQAVLQPRLAASTSADTRFYLLALLFAQRQYTDLASRYDFDWHRCGVLRLPLEGRQGLMQLIATPERYYSERVLRALGRDEASEMCGLPLSGPALWLPDGGWLDPVALCRAWLESCRDSLVLRTGFTVGKLQQETDVWVVTSNEGVSLQAEAVIIANGPAALGFDQTACLPLEPIRGQVTRSHATSASGALRCVVAGQRFLCPAQKGLHTIGASYLRGSEESTTTLADDAENLAGLAELFEAGLGLRPVAGEARASVRCNARDRFPLVGAVPDHKAFIERFGALRRNATRDIAQAGAYHPGLYINTAHGSHGLTSCPLSAELLACLIEGRRLPVTTEMTRLLSPARFIVRNLKKQRA